MLRDLLMAVIGGAASAVLVFLGFPLGLLGIVAFTRHRRRHDVDGD